MVVPVRTRRLLAAIGVLALIVQLGGCGSPSATDVIGVWANADGGQLSIKIDGTFAAENMPRGVFFERARRTAPPVTGTGFWKLAWDDGYWQVRLLFGHMPDYPHGFSTSVLVAGSGDSTELYGWVEEEGGARYELTRQE